MVSLFWLAFGVVVASTVIGLVTLWPEDRTIEQPVGLARPQTFGAEIVAIAAAPCRVPGQRGCRTVTVELKEGEDAGTRATLRSPIRPIASTSMSATASASPRINFHRRRNSAASSSTAIRSPTSSVGGRSSGSP